MSNRRERVQDAFKAFMVSKMLTTLWLHLNRSNCYIDFGNDPDWVTNNSAVHNLKAISMPEPSSQVADGRATTIKKTFSRQTSVQTSIKADKSVVWALLTNASNYPKWNSTVISIEGKIALGESIRLVSKLAPTRTFKLKVKQFEPSIRMSWGDAMGNRVYELSPQANGLVLFSMSEKIGGPVFPLFAKLIPPFDESFETFAADLKRAAESKSK